MKQTLYIIAFVLYLSGSAYSQASLYFPAATGAKWYFKVTPTDTLNNPIDSLSTYRIDTFAVNTTYGGLDAKMVLSKSGLEQTVPLQPYIDTSYISLNNNDGKTYFGASTFLNLLGGIDTTGIDSTLGGLGGLIDRLASFEGWYTNYKFNLTINAPNIFFVYDTTLTIDSIDFRIQLQLRSKRLSDTTITTNIGTFQTKRFVQSAVFSYYFLFAFIPFVTIPDTIWIAPENWIVQSHRPATNINLSLFGLGSFSLPGSKTVSIPEIMVTSISGDLYTNPADFTLAQNFPNPFNPETTVEFRIKKEGIYTLTLFNSLGETLSVISEQSYVAGTHRNNISLKALPSGIYLLQLTGPAGSKTIKLNLLK